MKAAIVVMSDPASGTDEALGRLFNGLAAAYDCKRNGDDVTLIFLGTGVRWAAEVVKEDHPAHGLYKEVEDIVAGVSSGCADAFGAREAAQEGGFDFLTGNAVPGTSGLPSLRTLAADGHSVMIF